MLDVIIIGGGPAGMSAALYSARYGLSTLIIEQVYYGGQAVNAHMVENYPGTGKISGVNLISSMENQIKEHKIKTVFEQVREISFNGSDYSVSTGSVSAAPSIYSAKTLIIATGQKPRELGLSGEAELTGAGISYCATCDGNFFRNKTVAVVGGGDTAVTDALFLSRICEAVHLIHRRDNFRAAKAETDKLNAPNIHLHMSCQVKKLLYSNNLNGIVISNSNDESEEEIAVSGLFIAVGYLPNSQLFEGKLDMSDYGYIITDDNMQTSVPGVFAAGDIREKGLRQIVTAVSDGAIAAYSAMHYISKI